MEPTVRGAWTQSGIAAAPSRSRIAAAQNPEYGFNCARTSRSATAAGNGIFGCRDRAPKTVAKMCERLQRQKSEKRVARNARRNALFGVVPETCGLRRLVCTENLSSGVVVGKSAKDGVRVDASDSLDL